MDWSSITPARLFTALASATGGTAITVTAAGYPKWIAIVLGALNLLFVGLVAVSGPIQQDADTYYAGQPFWQ